MISGKGNREGARQGPPQWRDIGATIYLFCYANGVEGFLLDLW